MLARHAIPRRSDDNAASLVSEAPVTGKTPSTSRTTVSDTADAAPAGEPVAVPLEVTEDVTVELNEGVAAAVPDDVGLLEPVDDGVATTLGDDVAEAVMDADEPGDREFVAV